MLFRSPVFPVFAELVLPELSELPSLSVGNIPLLATIPLVSSRRLSRDTGSSRGTEPIPEPVLVLSLCSGILGIRRLLVEWGRIGGSCSGTFSFGFVPICPLGVKSTGLLPSVMTPRTAPLLAGPGTLAIRPPVVLLRSNPGAVEPLVRDVAVSLLDLPLLLVVGLSGLFVLVSNRSQYESDPALLPLLHVPFPPCCLSLVFRNLGSRSAYPSFAISDSTWVLFVLCSGPVVFFRLLRIQVGASATVPCSTATLSGFSGVLPLLPSGCPPGVDPSAPVARQTVPVTRQSPSNTSSPSGLAMFFCV